jgi:hypothetical protein
LEEVSRAIVCSREKEKMVTDFIISPLVAAILGAINLENDTFTLMEYKEINLNPPVKVLCSNRESSRE